MKNSMTEPEQAFDTPEYWSTLNTIVRRIQEQEAR